jgi:hypothetical protein
MYAAENSSNPCNTSVPLIDDLLALVGKAKWFMSMDVKSGYYQIKIRECDKEKNGIRMS